MAQWIWALIAVIGIILIVAVVLLLNRQRRTIALQQRFGPEYKRTVESADDRRAAEAALTDRERRRAELDIAPLPEPDRLRYADQWRSLQASFVDQPVEAVASAEELLTKVMKDRGYPVGDFDEQADLVSVDHPEVVDNYRVAHGIHARNEVQEATTEDLREAMLRYRSLFDELLRPDQGLSDVHDDGDDDVRGTDVRGTGVRGTDVRGTDVRDTDVRGTDVRDTDLRDTDRRDLRQEQR